MTLPVEPKVVWAYAGMLGFLAVASTAIVVLRRTLRREAALTVVRHLGARVNGWWTMQVVSVAVLYIGELASIVLFALTSLLALREYGAVAPRGRGERRTLLWAYLVVLPVQYYLVYVGWFAFFSVFIPVYVFVFVHIRTLATDQTEQYLERTAKLHWGLMVCIYFVSHAAALLSLRLRGTGARCTTLLFFLFVVVEGSDMAQYLLGRCFGRRLLLPNISRSQTAVGFVAGALVGGLVGLALWWITPFPPLEAFGLSMALSVVGFFGALTVAAIHRARGTREYGLAIEGYGGTLNRFAALCFAAPVFYHYVRYYYA